jgi:hypothetical protein
MFGFITAVLLSISAFLLGLLITVVTRHAERTRSFSDHWEGASFWDRATGRPMREHQREMEANHSARMFAISCYVFSAVSAVGAVAAWATMDGR